MQIHYLLNRPTKDFEQKMEEDYNMFSLDREMLPSKIKKKLNLSTKLGSTNSC